MSKRGRPRVLVTDAGRGSAVAIIRSLGRRGWHVTAADSDRRSPGLYSRFAARRLRYADPIHEPAAMAAGLRRTIERFDIDLVIPVTDEAILPLLPMRSELDRITTIALPSNAAFGVMSDKAATYELARRLGVPTPRWALLEAGLRPEGVGEDLGWPVVVKPRRSRELTADGRISRHVVTYAAGPADLAAASAASATASAAGSVLVQEYVTGEGHGVELLMREGEVVAAFQHRRIREVPVTGGASSYRESVALDPALLEHATALLRDLGWTGVAMVEFRLGPDGPRLMEVNGRVWGSLPLAVRAGVDFPALLADVHLGRPVTAGPIGDYRIGVRSRSLPLEISWIGAVLSGRRGEAGLPVPARREALKVAAQALVPGGWDVLSVRDPLPGLLEIWKVASGSIGRLRRRSGPPAVA